MRNLMFVCAGLALVGGIVSVNLWRELRAERELTTQLRAQLGEQQAAAAPVGPLAALAPPQDATSSEVAQATGASPAATPAAKAAEQTATPPAAFLPIMLNQQEMMKDPEYRKARLAQTRMMMPQNYPGLAEELGLSPEEADRVFDLLAEQQMEMSDVSMLIATINGVPPDPAVAEDANRRMTDMRRRHDEALQVALGGRHPQWQEYQQTLGARQQVMQLNRTLEAVGVPLNPEQSRPLTAAYAAEQKRQREESQRMFGNARQAGPEEQARMMEEAFRMQAESNRRIVDAARPHLNARQLEALQASMDQQLAMNRASTRMMRQQREAGTAPTPAINSITIISAPPPAAP